MAKGYFTLSQYLQKAIQRRRLISGIGHDRQGRSIGGGAEGLPAADLAITEGGALAQNVVVGNSNGGIISRRRRRFFRS
nr:hypothetical protein Iba_scaffold14948CG0010 [Ipomoea batatas]